MEVFMRTDKKIVFNNILITLLVSALTTCLIYIWLSRIDNGGVNQTQNVTLSTSDVGKSKVNINTASKEELQSLPNIGEKLADGIINNRPYSNVHDLNRVKGIGEGIINNIKESVTVNE